MDTTVCAYLQAHACPFCGHAHMHECVLSCDCVCKLGFFVGRDLWCVTVSINVSEG